MGRSLCWWIFVLFLCEEITNAHRTTELNHMYGRYRGGLAKRIDVVEQVLVDDDRVQNPRYHYTNKQNYGAKYSSNINGGGDINDSGDMNAGNDINGSGPTVPSDKCDKSSTNFMPNHPDCVKPSDKCNATDLNFMPNHPDCSLDKCNETSTNFMPNHPDCDENMRCEDVCNPECTEVFDPDSSECQTNPCDENSPDFDPNNQECMIDPCDENSPNFDPNNSECKTGCKDVCNPECIEVFDPESSECQTNPCDENSPDFDPNNQECMTDPCDENSPDFDPDNSECITDPCDENSLNFMPDNPECMPNLSEPTESSMPNLSELPESKCEIMLTDMSTTRCEIKEEYQAITCGDCPKVNLDIEELTEACRTPSADLLDCMATIGSVEKDGKPCKMFEFKFKRSTMSPYCKKPKTEHPSSYNPKHAPQYQKRARVAYKKPPQYQKRPHVTYVRKGNQGVVRRKPNNYKSQRKLYKPTRMVTVLQGHY